MIWAKIINPNKRSEWTLLDYVEYMPRDRYKENIYGIYACCKSSDVYVDNDISYINDYFYNSRNKKVIPTLMSLCPSPALLKASIESTITAISENDDVVPYLDGNVIVAQTNGKVFNTKTDKFTNVNDSSNNTSLIKVTNMQTDIMIVDRDQLIEKLGGE